MQLFYMHARACVYMGICICLCGGDAHKHICMCVCVSCIFVCAPEYMRLVYSFLSMFCVRKGGRELYSYSCGVDNMVSVIAVG